MNLAHKDLRAHVVKLDLEVKPANKDLRENLEDKETAENKDLLVHLDNLDHLDNP